MSKKFDTKCDLPEYNSDIITKGMPILKNKNSIKNEIRLINDIKKKMSDPDSSTDTTTEYDDTYSIISEVVEEFTDNCKSGSNGYTIFITLFIMIICVYYLLMKSNKSEKSGGVELIRKNLIISVDNDLKYKSNV